MSRALIPSPFLLSRIDVIPITSHSEDSRSEKLKPQDPAGGPLEVGVCGKRGVGAYSISKSMGAFPSDSREVKQDLPLQPESCPRVSFVDVPFCSIRIWTVFCTE